MRKVLYIVCELEKELWLSQFLDEIREIQKAGKYEDSYVFLLHDDKQSERRIKDALNSVIGSPTYFVSFTSNMARDYQPANACESCAVNRYERVRSDLAKFIDKVYENDSHEDSLDIYIYVSSSLRGNNFERIELKAISNGLIAYRDHIRDAKILRMKDDYVILRDWINILQ